MLRRPLRSASLVHTHGTRRKMGEKALGQSLRALSTDENDTQDGKVTVVRFLVE